MKRMASLIALIALLMAAGCSHEDTDRNADTETAQPNIGLPGIVAQMARFGDLTGTLHVVVNGQTITGELWESEDDGMIRGFVDNVPLGQRVQVLIEIFLSGTRVAEAEREVNFNADDLEVRLTVDDFTWFVDPLGVWYCGDGEIEPWEDCDSGGDVENDGCDANCLQEEGWFCPGLGPCTTVCGDGMIVGGETCDDGNDTGGDGCSATCVTEDGFECGGPDGECRPVCGDGQVVGDEECDDGNAATGDGCSPDCRIEQSIDFHVGLHPSCIGICNEVEAFFGLQNDTIAVGEEVVFETVPDQIVELGAFDPYGICAWYDESVPTSQGGYSLECPDPTLFAFGVSPNCAGVCDEFSLELSLDFETWEGLDIGMVTPGNEVRFKMLWPDNYAIRVNSPAENCRFEDMQDVSGPSFTYTVYCPEEDLMPTADLTVSFDEDCNQTCPDGAAYMLNGAIVAYLYPGESVTLEVPQRTYVQEVVSPGTGCNVGASELSVGPEGFDDPYCCLCESNKRARKVGP